MTFEDRLPDLVRELRDVPTVIFHCTLSQQRGPTAARQYAAAVANSPPSSSAPKTVAPGVVEAPTESKPEAKELCGPEAQRVLVLRGGFSRFQQLYRRAWNYRAPLRSADDTVLVENFDRLVWGS